MIESVSGARVHNNVYMPSLESERTALELVRVSDSCVIAVTTTVYRTAASL